jgi:hypothetical protein
LFIFQIDGVESQFLKMPKLNFNREGMLQTSIKGQKTLPKKYHMPELFHQNFIRVQPVLNILGSYGWEMIGTSRIEQKPVAQNQAHDISGPYAQKL